MTVPASASLSEALELACAALRVAAAADPAGQPAAVQGRCLQLAEQAAAIGTAAQARILAAFTAGQGYTADAQYGAVPWLMFRTGVTKGAARGHVGWARRAAAHPEVTAALAEGTVLSESMARTICRWTGRLPEDCRDSADAILVAAARAGAREEDLAALAAEIYARSLPPDDGPQDRFADRSVRLETTFEGAGVIAGELTPECAALVGAVLEALGAPAGAGDLRTHDQRYHDALQEAMRRLAASGLLPERAGQPVKALVHVSLAELRAMDADTVLEEEWITAVRGRWAAARAAAAAGGSDGGAWLDGDAARGVSCDAMLVPVVTGEVDPGAVEDLVRLCVTLGGHHGPGGCAGHGEPDDPAGQGHGGPGEAGDRGQAGDPAGRDRSGHGCCAGAAPLTAHAREMLERQIISRAVDLVSGPGGLASFLRRQQLGARLAGP
ncbi:MAG TPA: DUF222 domain-containing protein, partial [Streptosporangiaceae bacterium]|nr:DUF222 domain-containing protein [Streptosporangiaceae bacterium]